MFEQPIIKIKTKLEFFLRIASLQIITLNCLILTNEKC